ncbi:MAG TPA: hypothetical protein VM689_01695 [Aliidongia sp.]|nr:hypothetical protein [Aliidongia sp.]
MPEIRDRRNPPPPEYQTAGEAFEMLANDLCEQCGESAILSALLSAYLNRALTSSGPEHIRRMLTFTLQNLDEIELIHASHGKACLKIAGCE